jgi:transglutaminase-like putative cysteine protease
MKLALRHETRFRYDTPVRSLTQYLRLTPRDTARQKVLEWKLAAPGDLVRTRDGYGNVLHVLTLDRQIEELRVSAAGRVETAGALDEPSDFTDTPLSPLLFLRATPLTRVDEALAALAESHRRRAGSLSGLRELASAVHRARLDRPSEDAAQAFIACCRLLGAPARYVSGYVAAQSAARNALANHAWAEVWVVDRWRSFDIAADGSIGEGHVKVAMGADYLDACPLRGVRVGGGVETMTSQAEIATAGQ